MIYSCSPSHINPSSEYTNLTTVLTVYSLGRCSFMSMSRQPYSFVVSREDWSLHRKGYQDQIRHQQKVRDVIKQNLPDLITEENIIMSDGKEIIKVPIRSLDEYRFIYNYQKQKHVGQGDGESQVGDVLGRDPVQKPGKGEKPGDQPGQDTVDAEISIEEIENMLFEELELPHLQQKDREQVETHKIVFSDVRKKGMMSNLDKKRTILENLRRNATAGNPGIHGINPDDLRYKTWDDIVVPESNAVIIAMMDTSGSMGLS
jgi:sporulation protein YhbH